MPNERASVFDSVVEDDNKGINIGDLVSRGSIEKPQVHPEEVKKVAESSGFTSRQPTKKRSKKRSPYIVQTNLKTRIGMKELMQSVSDRLDVYDQTTFELGLLALMEKEGMDDLVKKYRKLVD